MGYPSGIGGFVIGESPIGGGITEGIIPNIVPSYLYTEYNDDTDLQALVAAYNEYAQAYLDWFRNLNLPIYSAPTIVGPLLDWVMTGLYGIERPVLAFGMNHLSGPFNTEAFGTILFNGQQIVGPSSFQIASDDVYKRVGTWILYVGDGPQFNIEWLKRRVIRFLFGTNGSDPGVQQTYRVSVGFASDGTTYKRLVPGAYTNGGIGASAIFNGTAFGQTRFNQFTGTSEVPVNSYILFEKNTVVSIRIVGGKGTILALAAFNRMGFNSVPYNEVKANWTPYPAIPMASIFQAAVQSGVLPLPLQYTYEVSTI